MLIYQLPLILCSIQLHLILSYAISSSRANFHVRSSTTSLALHEKPKSKTNKERCNEYASTILQEDRWGGPIIGPVVRVMNDWAVGILFTGLLRVYNQFEVANRDQLLQLVFDRPKGKGMLTVSNHQSMADDPGIFAVALPWWRVRPEQLRYSLCTEGVFFYKPWLTSILGGGNVLPLDRTGNIDQPLFQRFAEKLQQGKWCHIFPEGRVWQNWRFEILFTANQSTTIQQQPTITTIQGGKLPRIISEGVHLGSFKAGVGKLVASAYPNDPIVLPMYHRGMDDIIPEKPLSLLDVLTNRPSVPRTPIPQRSSFIKQLYIGRPLSFHEKLSDYYQRYPQDQGNWPTDALRKIQLYREITEEIRHEVVRLEALAYQRERQEENKDKKRKC